MRIATVVGLAWNIPVKNYLSVLGFFWEHPKPSRCYFWCEYCYFWGRQYATSPTKTACSALGFLRLTSHTAVVTVVWSLLSGIGYKNCLTALGFLRLIPDIKHCYCCGLGLEYSRQKLRLRLGFLRQTPHTAFFLAIMWRLVYNGNRYIGNRYTS